MSYFLGNFTPKTSNYCLKNRVLGFPGISLTMVVSLRVMNPLESESVKNDHFKQSKIKTITAVSAKILATKQPPSKVGYLIPLKLDHITMSPRFLDVTNKQPRHKSFWSSTHFLKNKRDLDIGASDCPLYTP